MEFTTYPCLKEVKERKFLHVGPKSTLRNGYGTLHFMCTRGISMFLFDSNAKHLFGPLHSNSLHMQNTKELN